MTTFLQNVELSKRCASFIQNQHFDLGLLRLSYHVKVVNFCHLQGVGFINLSRIVVVVAMDDADRTLLNFHKVGKYYCALAWLCRSLARLTYTSRAFCLSHLGF